MGRVLLAGLPAPERAEHLSRAELKPLTEHTVTSPGRLAEILDQAAREGYSLIDEELEEGLRSIAVPVHDRAGRVVAAVNVSMHTSRRSADEARAETLPPLREAARNIENELQVAAHYVRVPLA
jgi:IclR family pca regulon transcriptional regulator